MPVWVIGFFVNLETHQKYVCKLQSMVSAICRRTKALECSYVTQPSSVAKSEPIDFSVPTLPDMRFTLELCKATNEFVISLV